MRQSASKSDEAAEDGALDPGPNPLDYIIGYRIRRAQLATFQEFIERLEGLNLRPAQFALLTVVERNPGLLQAQAGEMLAIKPANLVGLIDSLEKRRLTIRMQAKSDRRARALYLTPAGAALTSEATRIAMRHESELVERLGGPERRDEFLAMLDRIMLSAR